MQSRQEVKGEVGVGQTLYCRIVLVDEVALDQLDGQAGFTDTSATDDDELVLSQKLLLTI